MDGISGYFSDSSGTKSGGNSPGMTSLGEDLLKKIRDKRIKTASQRVQASGSSDVVEEMPSLGLVEQPDNPVIKLEPQVDSSENNAHSTTDQAAPVTPVPPDSVTSDPVKPNRSRSWSSSRSVSRSRSRSPKSSKRHRSRSESPRRRKHSRSKTPKRRNRSRSRSRTPKRRRLSRSRSRTPRRSRRSRSRTPKRRSRTPKRRRHSRSRSPRRSRSRSPKRRRRSRSRSKSPKRRRRSRSRTPPKRRRRSVSRDRRRRRSRSRSRSRDRKRQRSTSHSRDRRRSSDGSRRRKNDRSKTRSRTRSLSHGRSPSPHPGRSTDEQLRRLESKLDGMVGQVAQLETVQSSMVQSIAILTHLVESLGQQPPPPTVDTDLSYGQDLIAPSSPVHVMEDSRILFPTPGVAIPTSIVRVPDPEMPDHKVVLPYHGVVLPSHGVVLPSHGVVLPSREVLLPNHGVVLPNHGVVSSDPGVPVHISRAHSPPKGYNSNRNGVVLPNHGVVLPNRGVVSSDPGVPVHVSRADSPPKGYNPNRTCRKMLYKMEPVTVGRVREDGMVAIGLMNTEPPVLMKQHQMERALALSADGKIYACRLMKCLFSRSELAVSSFEGNSKTPDGVTAKLDPVRMDSILSQVELDFPGCTAGKGLGIIKKSINSACRAVRFKTKMQNLPLP